MAINKSPIRISKADYDMLRGLDADVEHARFELERAKRIGIDVTELEEQLRKAVDLRDNILKAYAPVEE
jgi:hypothetical protein